MKECIHCGASMPDEARFCQKCGKPQQGSAPVAPSATAPMPPAAGAPPTPAGSPVTTPPAAHSSFVPSPDGSAPASGTAPVQGGSMAPAAGPSAPPPSPAAGPYPHQPHAGAMPGPAAGAPPPYGAPPQQPPYGTAPYPSVPGGYAPPAVPQKPKKKGKGVLVALVAILLVAALAVCGFLFLPGLLGSGGNAAWADTFSYRYRAKTSDGAYCVILNDGSTIDFGKNISNASSSLDQSLWYSYEDTGKYAEGLSNSWHALMDVAIYDNTGKELATVKDAHNVVFNRATNTIYYQKEGRSGGLFRFTGGAEEFLASDVGEYVVSPNDKHILFTYEEELFYLQPGKEPEKLVDVVEDTQPMGISNNGRFRYFGEPLEEGRYFTSAGEITCLSSDGSTSTVKVKNHDNVEFLFEADASRMAVFSDVGMWVCSNGSFEKIHSSGTMVTTVSQVSRFYNSYGTYLTMNTLDKFIFGEENEKDGSVDLYLYNKGNISEVVDSLSDIGDIYVSDDCSAVAYTTSESLYRIDISGDKAESNRLARNVTTFSLSANGKTIYYYQEDSDGITGSLYYLSGSKDAVLLGEEVYNYRASRDGSYCAFVDFYDEDDEAGELLLSRNGGEAENLGEAARVYTVNNSGKVVFVTDKDSEDGESSYQMWLYDGKEAVQVAKKVFLGW